MTRAHPQPAAVRGCLALVLLGLALALLCGCGRAPAGRARAEELANWLAERSYSTYSTFRREGATPDRPPSPDGITLGSPNVFAAIGCSPDDLTSLDVFWADRRTSRPFAKPLTLALHGGGRDGPIPLADAPEQTLRRVRNTAVAVSESKLEDLRITCVSFAPMDAEQNFLARWFLFENTGDSRRHPRLRLQVTAPEEWTETDAGAWRRGDQFAIVSDARLSARGEDLELDIGSLRPGERAAAALLLTAARDKDALTDDVARAQAALPDLLPILEATREDWEAWCGRTRLATGDRRTDDLLDSLLCLLRSHIGPEAIHTGSVRYPHNRAWVRDSYWAQRALLELGRADEARLNLDFLHRGWQAAGIASYYEIPVSRAAGYGYSGVELPHYLVLMVRDAERAGAADGLAYWDMVKGCLDEAAVPPTGLQPMNGDETWLLAAPVRELDDLLDNSWLLIASAEYGAELAARAGDPVRAARYHVMAARARHALDAFRPRGDQPQWYAVGRGGDGSLDFSLCPEVFARGVILDVLPPTDEWITYGLVSSWEQLNFDRGIRAHSRSATISGGTPGYVLFAAADSDICDSLFNRELARRVPRFASATGCAWEFHDMHDPAWGGEKRRLWDSAVLLMGMVHALFDAEHSGNRVTFTPKAPPPAVLFERPAPAPLAREAADRFATRAGAALILHQRSPEHAARIARELLRQRNQQYGIASYPGGPPADASAIIVSPSPPPIGWRAIYAGYWLRDWGGPTQVWVRNKGDVFRDTEPLLRDLLVSLTPEREQPLPFPDANRDLAERFGEAPSGQAVLSARSGPRAASGLLELGGGRTLLALGDAEMTVVAERGERPQLLSLRASASTPRPEPVELTVTLPPGWWLIHARDMTGRWDRVRDPVSQFHLADGRSRLVYSFRAGEAPIHLTFQLARLKVASG